MSKNSIPTFEERVDKAIKDPYLKQSLQNIQEKFRTGKKAAFDELGNREAWRSRAEEIRTHTILHLDYYLDQFSNNVEKHGGKVFFAADAQEAIDYIVNLVRQKKAKTMVKSKSMVSEEVHLNQHLENMGIEVVETDLGEYIIQLAKETPSHIIGPAVHKNRRQIAELFSQEAGRTLSDDTPTLTQFARQKLRHKFLTADIGLSGCNFAIAETGSIVLVSNEGNARLTTTLPKTHVVMMGMERIVPSWEDLDIVLSLLPRSATGQKITSYVTAITGPRKANDLDGPEELHVIILDNGRSQALGSQFQSILNCIRCGACLNVCPVYRHIGGHAYGSVYSGPIGAVLTPILDGFDCWEELPYASSLCAACTEACPVKIPLHDMLIHLRQEETKEKRSPWTERVSFRTYAKVASNPKLYASAQKLARLALKPYSNKQGLIKKAPGPLKGWTQARDLPLPAAESFRQWWKREGHKGGTEHGQ